MQLSNTPGKLVLPFASAGGKNAIPAASQIGITPGAASLTDGFPPLTRTPIAAGGVPPSGLDMNGVLYEMSAIDRWAVAGGGYAFDSTFANNASVVGYPKGARVMQSDGLGYWRSTVENNVTDPESSPTGWVPDTASGISSVTMTNANVTLTPLQYGKPIIVITGTLTANLNLIFPAIAASWTVINSTTGAFTITAKTASGTGVILKPVQTLVGDATNIYSPVNIYLATAVTASGTAIDFTGIPATAKRVTVILTGISTNGVASVMVQIGDSGGVEVTGYLGSAVIVSAASNDAGNLSVGFGTRATAATSILTGALTIERFSGAADTWVARGMLAGQDGAYLHFFVGQKTLSGVLDRLRLTTSNGTDTFDAGSVNISIEE